MIRRTLAGFIGAGVLALATLPAQSAPQHHDAPATTTSSPAATKMALRDLWVEHVFWVRNYVVASEAKNTKARDAAEQEVVANAKQLAGAFEPYYGKAASDQLFTLLAGHWGAVKSLEDASVTSNAKLRTEATDKLTANAKEIAKFISGANPNLPYDAVFGLLAAHGAHHMAQIDQLHGGLYAEEAKTWAAMRSHMLMIADALADGIAKQFPAKS